MVDLYYNLSTNETSTHLKCLMNISTNRLADRLWLVIDTPVLFASHLFDLASVWNVVRELLTLSKQCLAPRSSRLAHTFVRGDLAFLSLKIYIFTSEPSVLVQFPILLSWLGIVQAWTSS